MTILKTNNKTVRHGDSALHLLAPSGSRPKEFRWCGPACRDCRKVSGYHTSPLRLSLFFTFHSFEERASLCSSFFNTSVSPPSEKCDNVSSFESWCFNIGGLSKIRGVVTQSYSQDTHTHTHTHTHTQKERGRERERERRERHGETIWWTHTMWSESQNSNLMSRHWLDKGSA